MEATPVEIRAAAPADADAIVELLTPFAAKQIVLPRTAADILAHLGNFQVAASGGRIVGAVALRDFGDGLEEIRSLVVAEDQWGAGLGSRLVKAALELAARRGASRVFALTLRPALFERLGFRKVGMSLFPQKVWLDCAKCSKRDRCDETALLLELH